MKTLTTLMMAGMLALAPAASFAKEKKMSGPEVVDIADISVGLNGLVCDFCSLALNKTFKKQDEVAGTYVDLDTKTLSVALADGKALDNDAIIKLVKKAGYSVTKITRKDGTEFIPPAKS
jgi:hypothetical protein